MKRPIVIVLASVVVGIVLLGGSALLLPGQYATQQTAQQSFTLDDDFTKVRKILVRTDAAKQIITMTGNSEFVEQKWTEASGGLGSLIPAALEGKLKWKLELHGTLKVRTLGSYVGQHVVTLSQVVDIEPDKLDSEVTLVKGSERLLNYEMSTVFSRTADGTTRVEQSLTQKILTDAPWFAHLIADRRVHASAARALANQEEAIRKVIAENRDRRWLLPAL